MVRLEVLAEADDKGESRPIDLQLVFVPEAVVLAELVPVADLHDLAAAHLASDVRVEWVVESD